METQPTKRYLTSAMLKIAYSEYAEIIGTYPSTVAMFAEHRKVAVFNFMNKYSDADCKKLVANQAKAKTAARKAKTSKKGK